MMAPRQLPFAPKPMAAESLSSWLLRVAAANFVTLAELLQGFASCYGWLWPSGLLEHSLSEAAVVALSKFCRVAPRQVQALDLCRRFPEFSPSLLLPFPKGPIRDERCLRQRARYRFCALCLQEQSLVHIRWEWTVACFLHCPIHQIPLQDHCGVCQEPDPLLFSGFASKPERSCGSCGVDLTDETDHQESPRANRAIVLSVEKAYREALLGTAPDPVLLGATTAQALRHFVENLLTLLIGGLNPSGVNSPRHCSRQDILHIITTLVVNAAPSADLSTRNQRYRRGVALWSSLLSVLPPHVGAQLEEASRRWPLRLRQRFAAGLRQRIRKR